MAMTEETKRALLMSGLSSEAIATMEGDYDVEANAVRNMRGPEGRTAGRVFTAANPLEHIGAAVQKYQGFKRLRDKKKDIGEAKEVQTEGRRAFSKYLSAKDASTNTQRPARGVGPVRTLEADAGAKIKQLRTKQRELSQAVGHDDTRISGQAKEALKTVDSELDRVQRSEEQRIDTQHKQAKMFLENQKEEAAKEQRGIVNDLNKDKLKEQARKNDMWYEIERAKLGSDKAGFANMTAGQETSLSNQAMTLGGIRRSVLDFKDSYAQPIKDELGINIPFANDFNKMLTTRAPGFMNENSKESARFFGAWQNMFTLENRNELFGATLTPSEERAWKGALEINPDMEPKQVRAYMDELERVTKARAKYNAETQIAGGSDPRVFDKVLGKAWRKWDLVTEEEQAYLENRGPRPEGDTETPYAKEQRAKSVDYTGSGLEEEKVIDWRDL